MSAVQLALVEQANAALEALVQREGDQESTGVARRLRMTDLTIQFIGEPKDVCMYQPRPRRPQREKANIGPIEEGWLNYQTFFKSEVTGDGFVTPMNTSLPLGDVAFPNESAELSWLVQTQKRELASLPELLKANGLTGISLSSSPEGDNDDELEACNIAEQRTGKVAAAVGDMSLEEAAPLLRRIEWERYIVACSQATRIRVIAADADAPIVPEVPAGLAIVSSNTRWQAKHLAMYAEHFFARFPGLEARHLATIQNNRQRANHYGALVWSLMTPREQLAWTMRAGIASRYIYEADDNTSRASFTNEVFDTRPRITGGEVELGLDDGDPYEPRETDLWPLSKRERRHGIVPIESAIRRADYALKTAYPKSSFEVR